MPAPSKDPGGMNYCKKCKRNKPLDDFRLMDKEKWEICEPCERRPV